MARIEDLIAQVGDEQLRSALATEVRELKRLKKFGLLFEEHLPETVRLWDMPVVPGELVAKKGGHGNQIWRVAEVRSGAATITSVAEPDRKEPGDTEKVACADLVVIRRFGDPIYPVLVPVDCVIRAKSATD